MQFEKNRVVVNSFACNLLIIFVVHNGIVGLTTIEQLSLSLFQYTIAVIVVFAYRKFSLSSLLLVGWLPWLGAAYVVLLLSIFASAVALPI